MTRADVHEVVERLEGISEPLMAIARKRLAAFRNTPTLPNRRAMDLSAKELDRFQTCSGSAKAAGFGSRGG